MNVPGDHAVDAYSLDKANPDNKTGYALLLDDVRAGDQWSILQ